MKIVPRSINSITILDIGFELSRDTGSSVAGFVELDIENQSQFIDVVNQLLEDKKNKIIVNLKNVVYVDSSGMWALFEAYKKTSHYDGALVLLSPNKDVMRVLEVTKMVSKLKVFDSETQAISSFK